MAAGIGAAAPGLGSLAFRLEVDGFEPVRVNLSRFGERITDFRPFWREYFAPAYYRELASNFATEGRAVGGWQALSAKYAAWKARHFPGKTILRRTDALYRSLTFDGAAPGPGGIFIATERALEVGTSIVYAKYHQAGGDHLPRRPMVFTTRRMGSMMGRLLHQFAWDMFGVGADQAARRRAGSTGGGLV